MAERRIFSKIIASLLRNVPTARDVLLIDQEGIQFAFVARSRNKRVEPRKYGSLMKAFLTPVQNLANEFDVEAPLVQAFCFSNAAITIINAGYGFLCIAHKILGFPLDFSAIQKTLAELSPQFPKLVESDGKLMQELSLGTGSDVKKLNYLARFQALFAQVFQALNAGTLEPSVQTVEGSKPEEMLATILPKVALENANFSCVVSGQGTILAHQGTPVDKIKSVLGSIVQIPATQANQVLMEDLLFAVTAFSDQSLLTCSYAGALKKKALYYCQHLPSTEVGLKTAMGPGYSVAKSLRDQIGTATSGVLTHTIDYLFYNFNKLSEIINSMISAQNYREAKPYLKRVVNLLQQHGDFDSAGDYQRWLGFIKFKEGDFKKATRNYQRAIVLHTKAGTFDKVGNHYKDLGNIAEKDNNPGKALEYYNKASLNFGKANKSEAQDKAIEKVAALQASFAEQMKAIIDQMTGEQIQLKYFCTKTKLKEPLVKEILLDMISEGVVPGQIDEAKGRYLKVDLSPKEQQDAIEKMKAAIVKQAKKTVTLGRDLGSITTDIDNVEAQLVKWEANFESINVPLHRYLQYQDLMDDKHFLEQQVRIIEANQPLTSPEGVPLTCMVCLNAITTGDPVVQCDNRHPAHAKCMSFWIERHKKCPVCEAALLPNILASFPSGPTSTRDDLKARDLAIQQLQQQLDSAHDEIAKLKGAIAAIKGLSQQEKDAATLLAAERQTKQELFSQVAQKERKISELETLIRNFQS